MWGIFKRRISSIIDLSNANNVEVYEVNSEFPKNIHSAILTLIEAVANNNISVADRDVVLAIKCNYCYGCSSAFVYARGVVRNKVLSISAMTVGTNGKFIETDKRTVAIYLEGRNDNNVIEVYGDPIQDMYKQYKNDSCYDVRVTKDGSLLPGMIDTVDLGVAFTFPVGHELQIRPRSGLTKNNILVQLGTVDYGYTGTVKLTMANLSDKEFIYKRGDRLGQIALCPVNTTSKIVFKKGKPDETERGENALGSTGVV